MTAMMSDYAVHTENLTIKFVEPLPTIAVQDVSISVLPGEFVSILGPSGCGKSTLLRAIAGFIAPFSGEIRSFGRSVEGPSSERAILFQKDATFPWKSALENVATALRWRGIDAPSARKEAAMWLSRVGLAGRERYYPSHLSGGMEQRVALARTFASAAKLLLLDEPFRALDPITQRKSWQVLLDLWQERASTVILVTHDIDEAMMLSDRIFILRGQPGRVAGVEKIDVPRPRSQDWLFTKDATVIRRKIYDYFSDS